MFQHIREIRKSFKIGADGVPVHTLKILFESRVLGRFVPLVSIVTLGNRFVAQEDTTPRSFVFDILGKVGLDTAFGRVDLKPRQNGKRFGFLSALFLDVGIRVFVISDNTAVKCGIGDLPDARGKGALDCLKPNVQVICIPQLRFGRRNTEQGQIVTACESVFKWICRFLIVRGDTFT